MTREAIPRSSEYQCWLDMKQRCFNEESQAYPYYGGRGITVCDRWRKSYAAFLADMGPRPENATLDRIDNDGDYEPGNCRWASRFRQVSNRRNTRRVVFEGQEISLTEACWRRGIDRKFVQTRIDRGWSPQRAFDTPRQWSHPRRKNRTGVVTDYSRAVMALLDRGDTDIKKTIDAIANEFARVGMPFEGMEIREEETIR